MDATYAGNILKKRRAESKEMRSLNLLLSCGMAVVLSTGCELNGDDDPPPVSKGTKPIVDWRLPGDTATNVLKPWAIAMGADGNFVISAMAGNFVGKYSQTGDVISVWGTSWGEGPSQFKTPSFLDVDADGNIFVADAGNARVQKFDSSGAYLGEWSQHLGAGEYSISVPGGIAVDRGAAVVYVRYSDRIQKFGLSGNYLGQFFLDLGGGNGVHSGVGGLAVDANGNVYVNVVAMRDSGNEVANFIQKYNGLGDLLWKSGDWVELGEYQSLPKPGFALEVDGTGNLYVVTMASGEAFAPLQKFDSSGNFISEFWPSAGEYCGAPGDLQHAVDLTFDSEGYLWVIQGGCVAKYAP